MKKSIQQLHEEFINECRYAGRLSERTLKGYKDVFSLLMKIFPSLNMDMLCPEIMAEFFKRLDERKRVVGRGILKQGIMASTVVSYRRRLNRFFIWLRQRNLLEVDPFESVPCPNVKYDIEYLKQEEVEKIFTAISFNIDWGSDLIRKRNILIVSCLLYTGIRRNELLGIKMTDLDLENRLLNIRGETSKSKTNRVLPINSKLEVAIKNYIGERKRGGYTTPYLFVGTKADEALGINGLEYMNRKIWDASGVKFHLHQFRHTFAMNLISRGVDISKVQQLLGHRNIVSTLVYVKSLPMKTLRKDVEALTLGSLI